VSRNSRRLFKIVWNGKQIKMRLTKRNYEIVQSDRSYRFRDTQKFQFGNVAVGDQKNFGEYEQFPELNEGTEF